jgi:hypothetical protein
MFCNFVAQLHNKLKSVYILKNIFFDNLLKNRRVFFNQTNLMHFKNRSYSQVILYKPFNLFENIFLFFSTFNKF